MLGKEVEFEAKYTLKSMKVTGLLISHVSLQSSDGSWGVFFFNIYKDSFIHPLRILIPGTEE